jgi:phage-related protein
MKLDLDTLIHAHIKQIEFAMGEIEIWIGDEQSSKAMEKDFDELESAVSNFKESFSAARQKRNNL